MSEAGYIAERKAAVYLMDKQYELYDVNYKCRFGEIDLIFTKGDEIIFVEVKSRSGNTIAEPKEFVDSAKRNRIIAASNYYLSSHKISLNPRFDVIEVMYERNKYEKVIIKSIKHLENAFTLD